MREGPDAPLPGVRGLVMRSQKKIFGGRIPRPAHPIRAWSPLITRAGTGNKLLAHDIMNSRLFNCAYRMQYINHFKDFSLQYKRASN